MQSAKAKLFSCWLLAFCVLMCGCIAQPLTGAIGNDVLSVSFLDVGQADAIIVSDGQGAVLVDAGNNGDGEIVLDYFKEQKIAELDYAVGTHPHEDHIGGLDEVIRAFNVRHVMLPAKASDTDAYEDMIAAIEYADADYLTAKTGESYRIGSFSMTILGPVIEYDDMNNNSIVLMIEYGETRFLLTGDIEERAEKDILAMGYDVECDVLKAPHHGSETSSSYLFLRQSNPEKVIIQCGADNSYGHPHEEAMTRYHDLGATIYRTDMAGTIVMISDGKEIIVNSRGSQGSVGHSADDGVAADNDIVVQEYIGNINTKRFHLISCTNLPAMKNRKTFFSRIDAVTAGYKPCSICTP